MTCPRGVCVASLTRAPASATRYGGALAQGESSQLVDGMRAALAAETKLRETLEVDVAAERDRRQRDHQAATAKQDDLEAVRGGEGAQN